MCGTRNEPAEPYSKHNIPITETNTMCLHDHEVCKIVKVIEAESRGLVAKHWGRRKWGVAFMGFGPA